MNSQSQYSQSKEDVVKMLSDGELIYSETETLQFILSLKPEFRCDAYLLIPTYGISFNQIFVLN